MKTLCIVVVFLIITTSCSNNISNENALVYNIKINNKERLSLDVNFNYKSDKTGVLLLKYESGSWEDNGISSIKNLKILPEPKSINFDRSNNLIKVKTEPNLNSTIHYSIIQDFEGSALNKFRNRPIIDKNYFHVLGSSLFVIPNKVFDTELSKVNIKINWNNLSNEEVFHSSFGPDRTLNLNVTNDELVASFFVGGDFRRYQFDYKGNLVYFVTRGDWKIFDEKEIFKILKETVTFQNDFWNDPREDIYSVSLIPTFERWTSTYKSNSIGGRSFSNSFVSFASNNEGTTLKSMSWLYNHELLHKWIVNTIKNENEVEQYWFSEGFTDYYSYKLMLKNRKLNAIEFIEILNYEVLIPHYKDKVNNVPNSELTWKNYWSNYSVYGKLPYRRGLLYAFLIDSQIKKYSQYTRSLDSLMQDLLAMALNDKSMRLNSSVFKQVLSNYLTDQAYIDFETYIEKGQIIDFADKLPEGLSLNFKDDIPFFIIESTMDTIVLENRLKF